MTGKGTALILVIATGALADASAGQSQLWIRQFGTNASDSAGGLAPDDAGGVFVTGRTEGNLVGPNAGYVDTWLARYNTAGTRLWIQQFGTSGEDRPGPLTPDGSGGVFIAGSTTDSLGGPTAGGYDAWLARYDSAGSRAWMIQFGTGLAEQSTGLAFDGAGGVFITWGVGWSGPTVGAWLARYDGAGHQLWAEHVAPTASVWAVASDGAGGCFIAGDDSGPFLARYDGMGAQLWYRHFGMGGTASSLARAGERVFIAGSTAGQSGVGRDPWVATYDIAGTQLWIRQFGSNVDDEAYSVAPDGAGGCTVCGPTSGSVSGPSGGGVDTWIARYDADGDQSWVHQFGTTAHDWPSSMAPDQGGGFFVSGHTGGSLGGPSAGSSDAWIARYGSSCYPDCNADGALTVADFGCFQTRFVAQDPYADCNADSAMTVADFGCFQTKFVAGCP